LIGIAIAQGFIESVDQPLASLLPEYADLIHSNPAKENLTLRHILTMSSGLEWDEETYPYSDSRNDANRMKHEADGVRFVLERPIVHEPGTHFQYARANSMLLSAIIKSRTGMNADIFAAKYLFKPLGIKDTRWERYTNGLTDTDGGLSLRPRDMAKIGLLFLDGGRWHGEQLIPQAWTEESTRGHLPAIAGATYGYHWWRTDTPVKADSVETFLASGYGGQKINVYPALNAVIIFTNDWSDGDDNEIRNLTLASNYILPAILPFSPWMAIIWLWFELPFP
jgi:CubicO group peptidase (beta-lactamase class C family)